MNQGNPNPSPETRSGGSRGNSPSRPKGARNKLSEVFPEDLHDDFQEHGADAIRKAREADPVAYVRVVASLLPKELNVKHDPLVEDVELKPGKRGPYKKRPENSK